MIELDPNSDRPLHRQLADALRAQILSGELPPGQRLPSELRLEQEANVNRTTVRQAVAILRGEGLVETRHPKGTFVREAPPEELVDLLRGTVIRSRMPTPEERRDLDVGEGVPILLVERRGETLAYAADRTALRIR